MAAVTDGKWARYGRWLLLGAIVWLFFPASYAAGSPSALDEGSDEAFAPAGPVGLDYLLGLRTNGTHPAYLAATFFAQLETQGFLPDGAVAASAAAPPGRTYRDVHMTCDVDGDGVPDMISNDLELNPPPGFNNAFSRFRVLSGANGSFLWGADNFIMTTLGLPEGVTYARQGRPAPEPPGNLAPAGSDVDGDGVCDFLAFGYDFQRGTTIAPPFFGTPFVRTFDTHVRLLSGADGKEIWRESQRTTIVGADEPFWGTFTVREIDNFPTGFLVVPGEEGPKVVVKTTDIHFAQVDDWTFVTSIVLRDSLFLQSARISERFEMRDAATGDLQWAREFTTEADAKFTNVTWITGAADLDGDGSPDLVLDQSVLTSPRGTEMRDPRPGAGGDPLFRYGRGVRMMVLDGDPAGQGDTLWSTVVLDTAPARQNLPVEEPFEQLVWTDAQILQDVTGDGVPDPMSLYLAQEENTPGSVNGAYLTHFVLLDGATGEVQWDVRQQGWGYATALRAGNETEESRPMVGLGTIDVPTAPASSGRFPPKSVRLVGVDGLDGSNLWSYESRFPQNSYLSYQLALTQYRQALAPFDLDADGVRDLVTPSRAVPPEGRNQVLLAAATNTYQVVSGADGSVLSELGTWGSNSLVIDCGTQGPYLTMLGGHARRLDLTRIDASTGDVVWRKPLHNDPNIRGSTAGIDLVAIGPRCATDDDNRTLFGINAQLYSFDRSGDLVPLIGAVEDSELAWHEPELDGEAPIPSVFEQYAPVPYEAPPVSQRAWTWGLPLIPGVLAGLGVALLRARPPGAAGRAAGGVLVVLLFVTAIFIPAAATAPDLDAPALVPGVLEGQVDETQDPGRGGALDGGEGNPSDPPTLPVASDQGGAGVPANSPLARFVARQAAAAHDADASAHVRAVQQYFHEAGFDAPPAYQRDFDENQTITFTNPIGDVDGDGVQDVVLDVYCMDLYGCYAYQDDMAYLQQWVSGMPCGPSHRIYAVSGATGEVFWSKNLQQPPHPVAELGCAMEFVIGTLPTPDGSLGLLVYRHSAFYPGLIDWWGTIDHTVYLLDGNGSVAWSFEETGYVAEAFRWGAVTQNVLLTPLIQMPPEKGVPLLPEGTAPALYLQGIGYEAVLADTWLALPGFSGPVTFLDSYKPDEWAARMDLATGTPAWRLPTFQPTEGRSVLPTLLQVNTVYDGYYYAPDNKRENYWTYIPCCFDGTADRVPDLLYTTIEWNDTPSTNTEGPYIIDAAIVQFDGADGSRMFRHPVVTNVPVPVGHPYHVNVGNGYEIEYELLGDADGDGSSDYILHSVGFLPDYTRLLSVRSGTDGSELWRLESPRHLEALVLGDADDDGGNDFVLFDWYNWEFPGYMGYDRANVSATEITLRRGADGSALWETTSYVSPADLEYLFANYRLNGVPDLDGDGVGEIPIDDPVYLEDLTVIHRMTFVSGRDASPVVEFTAVGAFAYPLGVGDVDADGNEDFGVLEGDVADLWFTLRNGTDASPEWSRRVLAVPASSYAWAFPRIRFDYLDDNVTGGHNLLMNMQLNVLTASGFYTSISIQASGVTTTEGVLLTTSIIPQLATYGGSNGSVAWSYPTIHEGDASLASDQPSPATELYLAIFETDEPLVGPAAVTAAVDAGVGALLFGAGAFVTQAASLPWARRVRTGGGPGVE